MTGSKDMYIKVWKIVSELSQEIKVSSMKKNIYPLKPECDQFNRENLARNDAMYVYLESNLFGHNDSISSVRFGEKACEAKTLEAPYTKFENLTI